MSKCSSLLGVVNSPCSSSCSLSSLLGLSWEVGRALQFVYDVGHVSKEGETWGKASGCKTLAFKLRDQTAVLNQCRASSVAAARLCN